VAAEKEPLNFDEIIHTCLYDKKVFAKEISKKVHNEIRLDGYKHHKKPIIIKDGKNKTMIHFFDLNNPSVAEDAYKAVDKYYEHTKANKDHQSDSFKDKDKQIEHFGSYADYTMLPYVTAHTASTHNKDHQLCVRQLIKRLQPLSDTINNWTNKAYSQLYTNMKDLDLGPNVPKSFGIFPTASINFNCASAFHHDIKDHRNALCIVCPLETFEGDELVFPELKLIFHVKQGQAIAFRSLLLVHGNLLITSGKRHSIVFYIHKSLLNKNILLLHLILVLMKL